MNPRYVVYSLLQGNDPATQLEVDRKRWPGGCMCGFILWSRAMIQAARKQIPQAFVVGGDLFDHELYDKWLWCNIAPYWGA